ncbi:hydroxyacid dehydrogenase [Cohnella thailandensis]|uniref:Hydroxyacid dehydrogenase n=1 Tax=Cohnella thailandensis TaxID=557557 RepID=A0A841SRX9_9BACL|nr:hydroxyacid dehydrogenase [Cohnella thailandensis]MBB6632660.1 hydroxyacid dehydrogenase [Cohnella thailandensis]MBP1975651.1 phosphoglycerate dehydrogenase-like enzyme [Cohnella thailandensis]
MNPLNVVMLQGRSRTDRIFTNEHLERIRRFGTLTVNGSDEDPTSALAAKLAEGADVVITSWGCPPLEAPILDRCPKLKLVLHAAGTVKPILSPEILPRGIRVGTANEALARGVAETALGLAIASLKNMWQLARNTREGEWHKQRERVRELYEVTVGVIGAGLAGRHLIRLLRSFEVRVLVSDPFVSETEVAGMGAVKAELDELLRSSDVVSFHAPSVPETDRMMNARTLALMKDDAILINTARGSLIDEDALVAELRKGRLWACLDVTNPEPPEADHPFRSLPNVTLLPHIAGAENNGLRRIGGFVADEVERYATGRPLKGEVDIAQLHRLA